MLLLSQRSEQCSLSSSCSHLPRLVSTPFSRSPSSGPVTQCTLERTKKDKKGDTIARAQHWSVLRGKMPFVNFSYCLPVLLDVERPLELQVLVLVVVGEHGGGLVVATAEHAGGCGLGLDWEENNVRSLLVLCKARDAVTHTSSRIRACPWCWASKSPGVRLARAGNGQSHIP